MLYHDHQAKLETLGQHWQDKLAFGHGPWAGDRNLVLKRHVLTNQMEVWYELPDRKPELVFAIPAEQFDIDRLCYQLWRADNQNVSAQEKAAEVDLKNAAMKAEKDRAAEDMKEAATEKLQWAINKDGNHALGPVTVPKDLQS